MKINRDRLATLLKYVRLDQQTEELTDEQFVEKLANYMEVNPDFLDYHGVSHPGRQIGRAHV